MPDRPTLPEPTGDQGEARFRADLAAYLNSLFLHELGKLLGELPEPTRVALMQELSERDPAWARLPRTGRSCPGAACASSWPTAVPPGGGPHLSSCAAGGPRPTGRPSSSAVSAGPRGGRAPGAEALRAWATSRDLVDRHQQREEPLAGPPRSPD
jgi:hypothetical protein